MKEREPTLNIGAIFFDQDPLWRIGKGRASYENFIFCLEGIARYEMNGQPLTLEKGEALFFPMGTVLQGNHEPDSHCQKYKALFRVPHSADIALPLLLTPSIRKLKASDSEYYKQRQRGRFAVCSGTGKSGGKSGSGFTARRN